ncbi:unnamed protein product, partial [Allacma fusca]
QTIEHRTHSTEKPNENVSQNKQDIVGPQEPNGPGGFPWA